MQRRSQWPLRDPRSLPASRLFAQTDQGAAAASSAATKSMGHKGSHRSYLRHTSNSHKERARASAEHIRKMKPGEIANPQ
jgi:hypothetical protein